MRFRIHQPVLFGLVALVATLTVAAQLAVGTVVRRHLMELRRSSLIESLALGEAWVRVTPRSQAGAVPGRIATGTNLRAALLDGEGDVIGSAGPPDTMISGIDVVRSSPETRAALAALPATPSQEPFFREGPEWLHGALPVRFATGEGGVLRLSVRLDPVTTTLAELRRWILRAGIAGLLLSLAFAYGLRRLYRRPLDLLAARARNLATGELSERAPRRMRIREFDRVSVAFNRLAEELQARFSELGRERDEMQALIDCMAEGVIALTDDARVLRANRAAIALLALPDIPPFAPAGTIVRHPELRELLEQAVIQPFRAREVSLDQRHLIVSARALDMGGAVVTFLDVTELRRLEQVRQDFVANASHELKTPLTSIRGFAETLIESEPPPDLRHRFLESIHQNTVRLQKLVDDLLDLSRLESGGWIARAEPVAIAPVARTAWDEFAERAEEQSVMFRVEGAGEAIADERGLAQIFRNLYDNALRYSEEEGSVSVRVESRGETIRIEVEDTGIGIPSHHLPRIFERFYRADAARARAEGGTGLGLAIVRHLVQAMGGEVTAESELGRGTRILLTLPAAPAPGSPDATGHGEAAVTNPLRSGDILETSR